MEMGLVMMYIIMQAILQIIGLSSDHIILIGINGYNVNLILRVVLALVNMLLENRALVLYQAVEQITNVKKLLLVVIQCIGE